MGYAYLLAWFNRVDFYDHSFFAHGSSVTEYEAARLIFIFYLAWLTYAAGALTGLFLFGRNKPMALPAWEHFPLFFVAGAGSGML